MTEEKLLHAELSYRIVGGAMEVHREIGPGFDEPHYHLALRDALRSEGMRVDFKPKAKLIHRGILADEFEPDLVVEDAVVPELKVLTADFGDEHILQVICYLKFLRKELGILFNFGLDKLQQRRIVFREPEKTATCNLDGLADDLTQGDHAVISRLGESLRSLLNQYGLGYRESTYRGLVKRS